MIVVVFIRNWRGVNDVCLSGLEGQRCRGSSLLCSQLTSVKFTGTITASAVLPVGHLNCPQYLYATLEHLAPYSMLLVSEKNKMRIKSCSLKQNNL